MLAAGKKAQGIIALVQAVPFAAGTFVQTEEGPVAHPRRHALEAQRQGTFGFAAEHAVAGHLQGAAGRGATVVEIEDRNAGEPDMGQHLLATAGLAMHAGGEHLVDQVEVDAGILEGRANGLASQRCTAVASAQRGERSHAHSRNQHAISHNPSSPTASPWLQVVRRSMP
ncbi:hypothetical protein D3C84_738750 [compost metagenome]